LLIISFTSDNASNKSLLGLGLVTSIEYNAISNNEVWRYNSKYSYWMMPTDSNNSNWGCSVYKSGDYSCTNASLYYGYNSATVRPVINVYKSSVE
jgi:hypothetical protein